MKTTASAVILVFVAALVLGVGCSQDERHELFDLDGKLFTEKFTCNQTFTGQPPVCSDLNQVDQIEFHRIGFTTFEARNVPDTGFLIEGTLTGSTFVWDATSPNGYTESGTWAFTSSGNSFSGPSHYVADDLSYAGDCNTNGDRGLSTPPDPPLVAGCP